MLYRQGSTGDPIRDIQRRLIALGETISEQERSARAFGLSTARAVRGFQQRRGLVADGLVGPETWRELVEASWRLGDRIIYLRSPQMRGDDVREVQDRLSKLGFDPGRIDGIFGPQTVRALVEFQRNFGLPADEIVGPLTLRALRGMPSFGGDTPVTQLREHEALRRMPATLSGLTIVLDPGHGPQDPGHTSPRGTREDQLAFALTRRLESTLAAAGTQVFLTRNAFTTPTDSERASLANTLQADLYIAIHSAAAEDPAACGASTYYFGNETWHSVIGKELSEHVQDALSKLGFVDGRAHAKTWGVLRETRMPAIQVECGYVTNEQDEMRLTEPAFQLQVAEAIFSALRTLAHAA
ncbi:MAG: N-acetylmuramoyl-L-alanine amidase [Actinomycetota bacterium]